MEWLGILIPIVALSVPLVAIIAEHRQKMKRLGASNDQTLHEIQALEAKNAELESRVQTLETIVTMDEGPARLRVEEPASADADVARRVVERRSAER